MDIDDIAKWIAGEWGVIVHATITFIASVLVAAFVMWKVVQREFTNRLADAASRLELSNDRVSDYERKLAGATPEEARARIDELEKMVTALRTRHRRLTDTQKRAIGNTIKGEALPIFENVHDRALEIIYPSPSEEAAVFAHDFADAFEEGGWAIEPAYMMSGHRIRRFGITIGVGSLGAKPRTAELVAAALTEAGVTFEWEETEYLADSERARLFVDMAEAV